MTAMTLKTSEAEVATDPGEKAEVFNNFFSGVLQAIMVFAPVSKNGLEVMD